jgi:hypothetical protein
VASDHRLLVPATEALLAGWTGPVVVEYGDGLHPEVWTGTTHSVDGCEGFAREPFRRLFLDCSRPEARDRCARVVFGRATEARLWRAHPESIPLLVGPGAEVLAAPTDSAEAFGVRPVPALADLAPADDTRLPDGSRWVDAAALAAVTRHVLGVA